jgi:hypothetical protein
VAIRRSWCSRSASGAGAQLGHGGLRAAAGRGVQPGVVAPEHHAAVDRERHVGLVLRAAGEPLEAAVGEVAHEHVAVADEGRAGARGVEHRRRAVHRRERRVVQPRGLAAVGGHRPGVAHRRALALEQVVQARAVEAPPGQLHRRADPVRMRHRLAQVERRRDGGRGVGGVRARGGGRRGDEGGRQGQDEGVAHARAPAGGRKAPSLASARLSPPPRSGDNPTRQGPGPPARRHTA